MKLYIMTGALIVLLVTFHMFQVSNDDYLYLQNRYKAVTNDCADAAALLYDQDDYGQGDKAFNKNEGNAAIRKIMVYSLGLNDSLKSGQGHLREAHTYYTYYFDAMGLTIYNEDRFISSNDISLPYTFHEPLTGYTQEIRAATVIVTIDAGTFDYNLNFIKNPELIRTSGYEYVACGDALSACAD